MVFGQRLHYGLQEAGGSHMGSVPRIIIDTGGGIGSALAILFAMCESGLALQGVTTVCGDWDAKQAAEQALRLLRLGASDAAASPPVAAGADRPFAHGRKGPLEEAHGRNGFGGALPPPPVGTVLDEPAASYLVRMANAYPGELTLVMTGPATNWPQALELDERLADKFRHIVIAGGTVFAAGNATPVAERGFFDDPEAAERLLATCGERLTVVGLDVTMRTRLTEDALDRLARCCPPERERIVAFMRRMLNHSFAYYRKEENWFGAASLSAAAAVLAVADPSLFRTSVMRATVETRAGLTAGMVVTDRRVRLRVGHQVRFCLEVDEERAVNRFLSAFA